MTPAGIEVCKAGWQQIMIAIKRSFYPGLKEDPMLIGMIEGLDQSIPQVCDLALVGLAARSAPPRAPLAVTAMTVADLSAWLAANPNEPLVTIPRPLAEALAAQIKEGLH